MLQPGQIIQDKYRIVRLIGQGGMGEVYEGENVSIARRVAIKVLLGEAAMNADIVQRFEREAQAAGRIGNDHILEVLDLGALPTGDRFMVMEFLDGEPLNSRIERLHQLTAEQATPIVLQALAGLSAAHHAGIIHRDLKPENLFVLKQKAGVPDYVKIIDFGISKFNQLSNEGMKMTKTGSVMGTPYYMSPEQANGSREADARSDLYAMGVILYECVTGAVPFDGKTFNELLFKIVLSDAPPARTHAPNLDPAFEAIIMKAMSREITHRFQTCEEFSQALRDYQAGRGLPVADVTGQLPAIQVATAAVSQVAPVRPGVHAGLSTGANWSNTGAHVPKKRSTAPLVAGLLGVGFLVLGGGAFAAYKVMHNSSASAPPPPSASVEPKAELTPPTAPSVALPAPPSAAEPIPSAPAASATASSKPSDPVTKPVVGRPNTVAHAAVRSNTPPVPPAKKKGGGGATDFGY
ncbi:MAG: serine/threonine-protein kinase [Polyangiaceae bacterium]